MGLGKSNSAATAVSNKLSIFGATANLVMISVGVGILGLPQVMEQAGWIGGYILLAIAAIASLWMARHLTDACVKYSKNGCEYPTYQQLGGLTYGKWGQLAVIISTDVFMLGLCVVLLVLFADNTMRMWPVMNETDWVLIYAAFMVPFVWIRSIKLISWLSMVGVLSVLATVVVIVVAGFSRLAEYVGTIDYSLFSFNQLGSAVGTLMTSFGLTAMIPTVMNNMDKPDKIGTSLYGAFAIIFSVYICLTVAGYGGFGNSIAQYGDIVSAISVATDCEKLIPAKAPKITVYIIRTALVGVCAIFATVIPGVTDMIALLGSVCGMPNVMLLPLLFYWKACIIDVVGIQGIYKGRVLKFAGELFIIALSLFKFGYGLYGSISSMINSP
ncbi:hypothetical protein FOL47_006570 [Perkinsus chesapeaki]|uniref:Amino acid transporter transmembrane domain-containing protein n=1 Tax=Perkinsus chesapeaki TaxID=330153 RepID=A0A7J6MX34_PERCH|nr:hypothetical protein FOL47_006570 [Perkinsus chesapeaki]